MRPLLHCLAVEVIKEGDAVKGIVTESKSGRQAILADRVVDCTGDADIAYLAGAKCTKVRLRPDSDFINLNLCGLWDKVMRQRYQEDNDLWFAVR